MLARVGDEATEDICYGDGGADGEGIISVWDTTDIISFVQLPGTNDIVLRRKLVSDET